MRIKLRSIRFLVVTAAILLASRGSAFASTAVPAATTCQAAKLAAAGKEVNAELLCAAVGAEFGNPINPSCLFKASRALTSAFTRAEAKGGCPTTNDSGTVDSAVEAFILRGPCRRQDGLGSTSG